MRPSRHCRVTRAVLLIAAVSTSFVSASAMAAYTIITPDTVGNVGIGARIALHNAPHVPAGGAVAAYLLRRTDGSYALRSAERWAGTWQAGEVRAHVDAVAPAIATDAAGFTHIIFSMGGSLQHAFRSHGVPWTVEVIPHSGLVTGLSVAADAMGRLQVSFEDEYGLGYALRTSGGSWSCEPVIAYSFGGGSGDPDNPVATSIAVDASGEPHIAFFYGETMIGRIASYAHKTSTGWSFSWPFDGEFVFSEWWGTAIAVDSQDRPHLAYDASQFQVVYGLHGGWTLEGALPQPAGRHVSLVMDSSDRPCVVVARNGQVVLAVLKDTGWAEETVAPCCNSESFALCLAYDAPRVALYDQCAGDLVIASGGSSNDYVETPDGPGAVGFGTSIGLTKFAPVFGPQATFWEEARISYSSYAGLGVWFAMRQGTSDWNVESVDPTGYGFTSLAPLEGAHSDAWGVAYCGDAGAGQTSLRYATRSPDGTWLIDNVTTEPGSIGTWNTWPTVSLAVDPGNRPHIVYSLGQCESSLWYATHDGWQWTSEEIAGICAPAALAVDGAGVPHVAYYDDAGSLLYARRDPGGWMTERVGSATLPYETAKPSIALDAQGRPSISHLRAQHLYVATRGDAGWAAELVDPDAWAGVHSSIQFDMLNRPHVAYSIGGSALKYAVKSASGWTLETLLGGGQVGRYPALALSESGKPRISCFAGDGQDLLYFARPLEPETVTGAEALTQPARFAMTVSGPNPARTGTPLEFALELPAADRIALALYDVAGRRIAVRAEEGAAMGRHVVRWNPGSLAPGVYFLHVRAVRHGEQTLRLVTLQ